MKLKYAALVLATSTLLGTAAHANTEAFNDADVQAVFDGEKSSMQLAALTEKEMKDTEGAFGPVGALVGGVGGLTGYALGAGISGSNWSWAEAAAATAGGAASGAAAGPAGVVWGFNRSVAAGTAMGVVRYYGW